MIKQLDISVIIPFKDHAKMTIDCISSLVKYGPPLKEVLLISNNSSDEELAIVTNYIQDYSHIRLVEYNHPFNYQKINNWGVKQASGSFILFLNNDIELRAESRGLIEHMYQKASQKSVGIVGCLLLYGDAKSIQHAGVYLVPEGLADHMYVRENYHDAIKYAGSDKYPYDISKDIPLTAVTGAAQMVEKRKFDSVNGFDEKFIICGGDVDLCIRHNTNGYQTWYVGGGFMLHKESISRKFTPIPAIDFYYSYLSYIQGYDPKVGDPFLPKITKKMKIYGA